MGLFSRRPKIEVCDMCGKSESDGCGSLFNHIAKIGPDEPAWLPANLRTVAQGEYTFLCVICDSYPSIKWPDEGGAWSGMVLHLGAAHRMGQFADSYVRPPFGMMRKG